MNIIQSDEAVGMRECMGIVYMHAVPEEKYALNY